MERRAAGCTDGDWTYAQLQACIAQEENEEGSVHDDPHLGRARHERRLPEPPSRHERRFPDPPSRANALDLLGHAFVPFEHATSARREKGFAAPRYVTRTPIQYDLLGRFLHVLEQQGAARGEMARAFGIRLKDVERAIDAWTKYVARAEPR
jgi:hypothetical protein